MQYIKEHKCVQAKTNIVLVGLKDDRCHMGNNPDSSEVNGNQLSSAMT